VEKSSPLLNPLLKKEQKERGASKRNEEMSCVFFRLDSPESQERRGFLRLPGGWKSGISHLWKREGCYI
jgi:hypothetical protein